MYFYGNEINLKEIFSNKSAIFRLSRRDGLATRSDMLHEEYGMTYNKRNDKLQIWSSLQPLSLCFSINRPAILPSYFHHFFFVKGKYIEPEIVTIFKRKLTVYVSKFILHN